MQERPADEEDVKRHARRHRSEGKALADGLRDLAAKVRANRTRLEAAERAALLQVEEEFGGSPSAGAGASSQLAARASTQAARKVTDSLRRTRELMSSELNRFDTTLRDLDEQGKSLKTTEDQHKGGIDGSLGAGKRKITRLQQREQTDRVLIGLAFAFFVLVVLYIIKKRVGLNFSSLYSLALSAVPPPPPSPPLDSSGGGGSSSVVDDSGGGGGGGGEVEGCGRRGECRRGRHRGARARFGGERVGR